MEKETEYIDPAPSPIPERVCRCGCGHTFIPTRKDKVFLNTQHANFGYNHGKRKKRAGQSKEIEKALRRNDSILRKYFEALPGKEINCFQDVLLSEGFRSELHVGSNIIDGTTYFYTYNFMFTLFQSEGHILIKIRKA